MTAKTYMVGNWKMNQTTAEVESFFADLKLENNQNNFWIAPQTLHISKCLELGADAGVLIGAQNCSEQEFGAFTGENSVDTLSEMGVHFTLIGHSERRTLFAETDKVINKKVIKAASAGVLPILCVGETLEERESGKTLDIVLGQIKAGLAGLNIQNESEVIVAYEPVWAIGTGKTATPEQAGEVHNAIRGLLIELYGDFGQDISILYGGSVKPNNVKDLLAQENINGGLVGGASLKAESFNALCAAC